MTSTNTITRENTSCAAATGPLQHALLFWGHPQNGVTQEIYRMARALLEIPAEQKTPDRKAHTHNAPPAHPDILIITPKDGKITLEAVRTLHPFLSMTPYQAHARVGVIEQAHTLLLASQQALLKILEEPPPNTYLLLGASNLARFLPTLRSRCVHRHVHCANTDNNNENETENLLTKEISPPEKAWTRLFSATPWEPPSEEANLFTQAYDHVVKSLETPMTADAIVTLAEDLSTKSPLATYALALYELHTHDIWAHTLGAGNKQTTLSKQALLQVASIFQAVRADPNPTGNTLKYACEAVLFALHELVAYHDKSRLFCGGFL